MNSTIASLIKDDLDLNLIDFRLDRLLVQANIITDFQLNCLKEIAVSKQSSSGGQLVPSELIESSNLDSAAAADDRV